MNILIIEDDVFLATKIAKVFSSKMMTHRVRIVESLQDFYNEASMLDAYDLILTDLKLAPHEKDLSGYKIIQMVREHDKKISIVVMSGQSDIERLQRAFELGASDYIMKPVRLKELELRVLNWFQNYCPSNISFLGKVYQYADMMYDLEKNEFYFQGVPIPLTKNSKYILSLFFRNPERLLSDHFLIEKIWGDMQLSVQRNLRVSILRLKQSLQPFGLDRWIHNIHGEWYIFSPK